MDASDADSPPVRLRHGRYHRTMGALSPRQARTDFLAEMFDVLQRAGAAPFLVKNSSRFGPTLAVLAEHREPTLRALAASFAQPEVYFRVLGERKPTGPVQHLDGELLRDAAQCPALRVGRLWISAGDHLVYDLAYGTDLEFWEPDPDGGDAVVAPRLNDAAQYVPRELLAPAVVHADGRGWPSIALFDRTFLDDVTFPVDAVYTWVDGADPAWQQRFARARAELEGREYHPEAVAPSRFVSRDELRYSMRSLQMYAPWVRHVYLVTDQQVPRWLDTSCPRVTVVDHRDIFADPRVLPVFNSNAIISQLHRIDGLSEHYLYLNDDVFFGRDACPEDFWFGNGIAKVFPSMVSRAFGTASPDDATVVSAAKNIRAMIEAGSGRTISRAIRHTPHAQRRSINAEASERFADVFTATAGQKFRSHTDVPLDQFFHYYAQATGRAVASTIAYEYVNLGFASMTERLHSLLAERDRAVFCLNDSDQDEAPVPLGDVTRFLADYFPVPSCFERPDGD